MENRERIIELLTTVRHTTNDIEKVADEICSLFSVSQQRELLLQAFKDGFKAATDSIVSANELTIKPKQR